MRAGGVKRSRVVSIAVLFVSGMLAAAGLRADDSSWSTDSAQPARFVAAHGKRAAVFGYSEKGLEAWAYPLQRLDSYDVSFREQNGTTEIAGRSTLRRIDYSPEAITRVYVGNDFVVREKLFVPLDAPGAIITYDVDAVRPIDIVV